MKLKRYVFKCLEKSASILGLHLSKYSPEECLTAVVNYYFGANYAHTTKNDSFNSDYYQSLHDTNKYFQQNNWLLDDLSLVLKNYPETITELATGNGKFAREASSYCDKVFALDWAESTELASLPNNVIFQKKNIVVDEIPPSEVVCSADFLEHLPQDSLPKVLRKICESAPNGYHKIACYDDGHSHLSILPPWAWLNLFHKNGGKDYKIVSTVFRRGNPTQIVITISNY